MRSLASVRRRQEKLRAAQEKQSHLPPQKVIRDVVVPEMITVQELANRMAERGAEVIHMQDSLHGQTPRRVPK